MLQFGFTTMTHSTGQGWLLWRWRLALFIVPVVSCGLSKEAVRVIVIAIVIVNTTSYIAPLVASHF